MKIFGASKGNWRHWEPQAFHYDFDFMWPMKAEKAKNEFQRSQKALYDVEVKCWTFSTSSRISDWTYAVLCLCQYVERILWACTQINHIKPFLKTYRAMGLKFAWLSPFTSVPYCEAAQLEREIQQLPRLEVPDPCTAQSCSLHFWLDMGLSKDGLSVFIISESYQYLSYQRKYAVTHHTCLLVAAPGWWDRSAYGPAERQRIKVAEGHALQDIHHRIITWSYP